MTTEIKKGSVIEAQIETLAFGGKGIARTDGMVVFVEKALPGDKVRARITKRKPQYAEAEIEEILTPSPARIEARCKVFGNCGGCKWQNYDYAEQLRTKQQHVEESLRHIGKQLNFALSPIIASPDPWNYRNKMEFSFGRSDPGLIEIGFHKSGDFRQIVEIESCTIQPPVLDDALEFFTTELRAEAAREGDFFHAYSQSRHSGFLRHLIFRYSQTNGEFLATLLTAAGNWKGAQAFAARLQARFPQCQGFIWGINNALSDIARMDEQKLQVGRGWIEETIGGKTFRVSPFSFFQTNTRGAEVLYDTVKDYAELSGTETILDAYCGTGTIGIYLSDRARSVVGIELVKDAVWDARHNATQNRATNCTFLAGEMREVLRNLPNLTGQRGFDRVIVDPPRGGMDKKSLRNLLEIRAPILVYVSCNPATLARDVVALAEAGYAIQKVQPVDMFPHTYHVETVIQFKLGPAHKENSPS